MSRYYIDNVASKPNSNIEKFDMLKKHILNKKSIKTNEIIFNKLRPFIFPCGIRKLDEYLKVNPVNINDIDTYTKFVIAYSTHFINKHADNVVKDYVITFAPDVCYPLLFGYIVLLSADRVYAYNNCSRIDKLGSYVCENSHTLFVESRRFLSMYTQSRFGTFIGLTLSVLRRNVGTQAFSPIDVF